MALLSKGELDTILKYVHGRLRAPHHQLGGDYDNTRDALCELTQRVVAHASPSDDKVAELVNASYDRAKNPLSAPSFAPPTNNPHMETRILEIIKSVSLDATDAIVRSMLHMLPSPRAQCQFGFGENFIAVEGVLRNKKAQDTAYDYMYDIINTAHCNDAPPNVDGFELQSVIITEDDPKIENCDTYRPELSTHTKKYLGELKGQKRTINNRMTHFTDSMQELVLPPCFCSITPEQVKEYWNIDMQTEVDKIKLKLEIKMGELELHQMKCLVCCNPASVLVTIFKTADGKFVQQCRVVNNVDVHTHSTWITINLPRSTGFLTNTSQSGSNTLQKLCGETGDVNLMLDGRNTKKNPACKFSTQSIKAMCKHIANILGLSSPMIGESTCGPTWHTFVVLSRALNLVYSEYEYKRLADCVWRGEESRDMVSMLTRVLSKLGELQGLKRGTCHIPEAHIAFIKIVCAASHQIHARCKQVSKHVPPMIDAIFHTTIRKGGGDDGGDEANIIDIIDRVLSASCELLTAQKKKSDASFDKKKSGKGLRYGNTLLPELTEQRGKQHFAGDLWGGHKGRMWVTEQLILTMRRYFETHLQQLQRKHDTCCIIAAPAPGLNANTGAAEPGVLGGDEYACADLLEQPADRLLELRTRIDIEQQNLDAKRKKLDDAQQSLDAQRTNLCTVLEQLSLPWHGNDDEHGRKRQKKI